MSWFGFRFRAFNGLSSRRSSSNSKVASKFAFFDCMREQNVRPAFGTHKEEDDVRPVRMAAQTLSDRASPTQWIGTRGVS